MKKSLTRKKIIATVVAFVFLCATAYALGAAHARSGHFSTVRPDSIAKCFTTSAASTSPSLCLHSTVQILLSTYSPAELMVYITATSTPASIRFNCHATGHVIGELTYKKDGSLERALEQCTNNCRSACTHGAIGAGTLAQIGRLYPDEDIAHANQAELQSLGTQYCAHDGSTCHAIGHVAYIGTNDRMEALRVCDAVSAGWNREACYQGAFMEEAGNLQSLLFTAKTADSVPPHDYTFPCTSLPEKYRSSCFLYLTKYQGPIFQRDRITTAQGRLRAASLACEKLTSRDRASCFTGIGINDFIFGYNNLNPSSLESLCSSFVQSTDRNACTIGIVLQFVYLDFNGVYEYCGNIRDEDRRELCYNATFQSAEAHYGVTDDAPKICGAAPACREAYETFTRNRMKLPDYRFGLFGDDTK